MQADLQAVWARLQEHGKRLAATSATELCEQDEHRFDKHALRRPGWSVDFSREPIDDDAWEDLYRLPDAAGLSEAIRALLCGEVVNESEQQAALHPASRILDAESPLQPPPDLLKTLAAQREAALNFAEAFRQSELRGHSGRPIVNLVNLGIGGADLGVRLIASAFGDQLPPGQRVFCAATPAELRPLLGQLDAAETCFVANSKSFTTFETLESTTLARDWLGSDAARQQQTIATTAHPDRAQDFGIAPNNIYPFSKEIGGRYSLWSPAGLAAAAVLGRHDYLELLTGAHAADLELPQTPWQNNLIVRLALRDLWHSQVGGCPTKAFFPYPRKLSALVPYLAQLEMESLGKPGKSRTGPIFWGGWAPSAQHSQFQLLYQGTHRVPIELLAVAGDPAEGKEYAMSLAQAKALSDSGGYSSSRTQSQPITFGALEKVAPRPLGFLLGCWEHRIFVQARILALNPFDQPGVQHSRERANQSANLIKEPANPDPITPRLAQWGKKPTP